MNYLRAEVKVFDPDIIGITESWTDDKISDTKIQIEGFEVFRWLRISWTLKRFLPIFVGDPMQQGSYDR